MANPFVHVELNTTDVPTAKAFYEKLFDWKLEDVPMPNGSYTMIHVGEGTGGGIMQHPVPGSPSAWLAYVLVDDIAAATEKARSLGATPTRFSATSMRSGPNGNGVPAARSSFLKTAPGANPTAAWRAWRSAPTARLCSA